MPVPPPLPHLLPQNRRVRHLRGIHLRNLTFTPPRDQSVDDAEINQSPSRLDTPQQLQYSRSSENLRPEKVRRRSTILANASPLTRQKMREFALDDRACDAFFSLHGGGDQDPLYVSELGERATVRAPLPWCVPNITADGRFRISITSSSTCASMIRGSPDHPQSR